MWLLDTEHITLRYFDKPPSRYAILSHVWERHEQTFQEVQGFSEPHKDACPKLQGCCRLARLQGFEWVWIDTCCIDKTNSVELSEAINSMYKWYTNASVCLAYLYDVDPGRESLASPNSSFRSSLWFTRGWTLQELIAPKSVVFYSQKWTALGTKDMLAVLLQEISGVDASILSARVPLASISIGKRMSWASGRRTTRPEDAAYSLMGIFDINMPTIYGEGGTRAFRRLQEEIMRISPDQTLFVWGPTCALSSLSTPISEEHHTAVSPENTAQIDGFCEDSDTPVRSTAQSAQSYLLAPSATSFSSTHPISFPLAISHAEFMESLGRHCADSSISQIDMNEVRLNSVSR